MPVSHRATTTLSLPSHPIHAPVVTPAGRPTHPTHSDAESHKLLDVGLKLAALNGFEAASSLTLSTRSSLLVNNLTTQLPAAARQGWQ
jgi:hypothetical protein